MSKDPRQLQAAWFGRTSALQMLPIITEDDFDDLDPVAKREWKGYHVSMTYEIWSHEDVEHGETNDRGWSYQKSHFDSLEEALDSVEHDANWIEWSSSSPRAGDWISSEGDEDYRTGDRTYHSLFIERVDRVDLSKDEIRYISKMLRL